MFRKAYAFGIFFFFVIGLFLLIGCDKQITGNDNPALALNGVPTSQINWVPLKGEYTNQSDALAKKGHAGKYILPERGGVVGGAQTYSNWVEIPAGAVSAKTYITVDIVPTPSGYNVEFLPCMQFDKEVQITLSWKFFNISESDIREGNFQIYYSQDGLTWFPIEAADYLVDFDNQTVTFNSQHFTRYGWGF